MGRCSASYDASRDVAHLEKQLLGRGLESGVLEVKNCCHRQTPDGRQTPDTEHRTPDRVKYGGSTLPKNTLYFNKLPFSFYLMGTLYVNNPHFSFPLDSLQ